MLRWARAKAPQRTENRASAALRLFAPACVLRRACTSAARSRAALVGRKKPRDMPLHTLIQVREIVVPTVLVLVLVAFLVLVFRRSV